MAFAFRLSRPSGSCIVSYIFLFRVDPGQPIAFRFIDLSDHESYVPELPEVHVPELPESYVPELPEGVPLCQSFCLSLLSRISGGPFFFKAFSLPRGSRPAICLPPHLSLIKVSMLGEP